MKAVSGTARWRQADNASASVARRIGSVEAPEQHLPTIAGPEPEPVEVCDGTHRWHRLFKANRCFPRHVRPVDIKMIIVLCGVSALGVQFVGYVDPRQGLVAGDRSCQPAAIGPALCD